MMGLRPSPPDTTPWPNRHNWFPSGRVDSCHKASSQQITRHTCVCHCVGRWWLYNSFFKFMLASTAIGKTQNDLFADFRAALNWILSIYSTDTLRDITGTVIIIVIIDRRHHHVSVTVIGHCYSHWTNQKKLIKWFLVIGIRNHQQINSWKRKQSIFFL